MSILSDFAIRYTAAWCSKSAPSVAAHFAERGSLAINGGGPAVAPTLAGTNTGPAEPAARSGSTGSSTGESAQMA
jgi:hypothetical protein